MVSWKAFDCADAYDSGYDEYIQAAHRRPSSWTGTPCLSWHIAVWPEKNKDPQNKRKFEDYIAARSSWIDRINAFIEKLQSPPFQPEGSPVLKFTFVEYPDRVEPGYDDEIADENISGADDETIDRKQQSWTAIEPFAVNFPMAWRGMAIWCVVTHSIDFFTFTFIVDLDRSLDYKPYPTQHESEKLLEKSFADAVKATIEGYQITSHSQPHDDSRFTKGLERRDKEPTQEEKEAAEYLYQTFWRDFANDIRTLAERRAEEPLFPGKIFADFRGAVLRFDENWRHNNKEQRLDLDVSKHVFGQNESRWALSGMWPFINALNPGINNRDVVACTMLGGRAIYVSALGADREPNWVDGDLIHEDPLQPETRRLPVCFLICVKNRSNRRQIGRLIERINTLGTLRLAALKDLIAIREISADVRLLGFELDYVTRRLQKIFRRQYERNIPVAQIKKDQQAAEIDLIDIGRKLNISSRKVTGGLHYRASRSQLFVTNFKARVEDLRIGRIELWQPYDEFVRRTLFETYEFIESVDERMMALRNRLRQLLTGMQTWSLVKLTAGIRELNEDANTLTSSIKNLNEETNELQTSAEWIQAILLVIAFSTIFGEVFQPAYYAVRYALDFDPLNFVRIIVKASGEAGLASAVASLETDVKASTAKTLGYIFGAFVGMFVFFILRRINRNAARRKQQQRAATEGDKDREA